MQDFHQTYSHITGNQGSAQILWENKRETSREGLFGGAKVGSYETLDGQNHRQSLAFSERGHPKPFLTKPIIPIFLMFHPLIYSNMRNMWINPRPCCKRQEWGAHPRGSCNNTLLRRLFKSKWLLRSVLRRRLYGFSVKIRFLEGFLEGSLS